MFERHIYKKYYPIRNTEKLCYIQRRYPNDYDKIYKYVNKHAHNVNFKNTDQLLKALLRPICICDIKQNDLDFINESIYIHKYII